MNACRVIKDLLRPAYRCYLAHRNSGANVSCNICGKSFKELRPIKGRHVDGSSFIIPDHVGNCWYCNSYPRNRELYYWLIHEYHILEKKNVKVLHVAPELPISNKLRKLSNIEYVCIDKRCKGYSYPKYVSDGDICKLKFKDDSFDLIICNHVLEHVIEDRIAMKEIKRVLKPNGIAILMVPIDLELEVSVEEGKDENLSPNEREKRFGQFDHVRIYGLDYFNRLKCVGFIVERKRYDNCIISQYGLSPDEEIVICKRTLLL